MPQNQKPRPWEQEQGLESSSFGTWLRRQREMREIALRDIADTSKISLRYLEALEADQFDVLPAPVFAKGFLREYAKYVGLDPDDAVNRYLATVQELEPTDKGVETTLPKVQSSTHWTLGLFLTAGVALLFGVVAVISFYAERRDRQQPVPPMAAPAVATAQVPPAVPPQATLNSPLRVTLDFTQNCWVEALIDGRRRISELRVQGESLLIDAERQIELTLDNVAGVAVEVNGRPFRWDAQDGEPVLIDLAVVRAFGGRPD